MGKEYGGARRGEKKQKQKHSPFPASLECITQLTQLIAEFHRHLKIPHFLCKQLLLMC